MHILEDRPPRASAQLTLGASHLATAFTLIELLVVMTIILILMALILPAIKKMQIQSMRARASAEVSAVANAVRGYRETYGKFPGQTKVDLDGKILAKTVCDILTGTNSNTRGSVFLGFKSSWIVTNTPPLAEFVDPWGRRLTIAMDENGDGRVQATLACVENPAATEDIAVTNPVAVMSWGPEPEDRSQRVYSWGR